MFLERCLRSFSMLIAFTLFAIVAFTHADAQQEKLLVDQKVLQAEQARINAIAKAKKAAVAVFDAAAKGGGSGIVVTPNGYALTNYHVVKPCGSFMRCSMADGNLYDAVVVGIDPVGDVALIKLMGREDFPVADIADSDTVQVGQWCFAIGNPFLLATDFQPTVTYGIVSGVHRYQFPAGTLLEYADCIQTDAAINPGNSGGPLFNESGQLIGINGRGSFEKRGRVNVGVGYAISINQIKHFMGYLRSGRILDHATLGATVTASEDGRVLVSNILESSDAFRRGLRFDDELVEFGGRQIHSPNEFKNVLGIYPKGWRVPIKFKREGETFNKWVRLDGVHSRLELMQKVQGVRRPPASKPKQEKPAEPKPSDPKPSGKKRPSGDEPKQLPKKLPIPIKPPGQKKKVEIPEAAKKLIQNRDGFSNYYFNVLERKRIWDRWSAQFAKADINGTWKFSGKMGNGKASFVLGEKTAAGKYSDGNTDILDFEKDLEVQLDPFGSGGLILALHLWRQFMVEGPQRFGDVYYLGTAPLPAKGKVLDVIVGTRDVVEVQIYFGDDRLPAAIEVFPDLDTDPCELHFSNYKKIAGSMMPQTIEIRHAEKVFGKLEVENFEFDGGKQ